MKSHEIRKKIKNPADNYDQALYVSEDLPQTGRVMVAGRRCLEGHNATSR